MIKVEREINHLSVIIINPLRDISQEGESNW